MFTYLDPAVRERLVDEGKLVRVDREGNTLAPEERTGGQAISILGPIPLPLQNGERDVTVDWFACVRNTELSKVEELAAQLREQHTQQLFPFSKVFPLRFSIFLCLNIVANESAFYTFIINENRRYS